MVMSERKELRIRLKFFPHERLIDGGAFDQDGEHWRKSRMGQGQRISSVWDLSPKCLQRVQMGSIARNWIFRLSPERILG